MKSQKSPLHQRPDTSAPESSDRLEILQVGKYYPPYMGGIETHLQTLAEELRHHVDLKVLVANETARTEIQEINGVSVQRLGTAFHFASAPFVPRLVSELRRSKADVIHIHHPNPVATLAYMLSGHRGRLVVSYHSDIVRQRVLGTVFTPLLHRFLERASAILVATPTIAETSSILTRHREKCHVVPYGIDLERFASRDEEAVERIQARFGPRLVLGVGRLVYYKGFEYLIRAMCDVDGHLLIVGDGPLRKPLLQLVESLRLDGRVTLLGGVERLEPLYHAADVYVLPSVARSEAFGIVQVEAMASGTPVINTALQSGVPWVSPAGISGLTVPPRDTPALSDAINLLLSDGKLRRELGANGRERALAEFTKERMARRVLDIYHQVTRSPQV